MVCVGAHHAPCNPVLVKLLLPCKAPCTQTANRLASCLNNALPCG
jgi:hypothetical protein